MPLLIAPEVDGVSIVLLGQLNPAIFHPQWFAKNGLVDSAATEDAEVEIVHPEISKFQIDQRFSFSVERHRFVLDIATPLFVEGSDLVLRTFCEFLPHTPVGRLGINRNVLFAVSSEEKRNEIGKLLAPHEPWGSWGEALDKDGANRGGLYSLTMEEKGLDDRPAGFIRTKIEPSAQIQDNVGIYMQVNDDYSLTELEGLAGCQEIMEILQNNFDQSIRRSEEIINHIMELTS